MKKEGIFSFVIISLSVASVFSTSCSFRQSKSTTGFSDKVSEIVNNRCVQCHSGSSPSAGFLIEDPEALVTLGYVKKGDSANSLLYKKLSATPPRGDRMPKGGPYLTDVELGYFASWIDSLPTDSAVTPTASSSPVRTMSFATDVKPLLLKNCVRCHSDNAPDYSGSPPEGFSMSASAVSGDNSSAPTVINYSAVSAAATLICSKVKGVSMPSMPYGLPLLTADEQTVFCGWSSQGALNN